MEATLKCGPRGEAKKYEDDIIISGLMIPKLKRVLEKRLRLTKEVRVTKPPPYDRAKRAHAATRGSADAAYTRRECTRWRFRQTD